MDVTEVGGTRVAVDVARTQRAYAAISGRPGDRCDCAYCRNFMALGTAACPADVLNFFERAGIDAGQPAETYELGPTTPGRRLYGGEYYFFGTAAITDASRLDPSRGFDFCFTAPTPLAQDEFIQEGSTCFHFVADLPWVIADSP